MKRDLFDYPLPKKLIAQRPIIPRDHSKLMVLDKKKKRIYHHKFFELPDLIDSSYIMVFNDTKVLPLKFLAQKPSGGKIELLFLERIKKDIWEVLAKGKVKPELEINLNKRIKIKFLKRVNNVWWINVVSGREKLNDFLKTKGKMPLPPYIKENIAESKARIYYQSIFARKQGSAAAPTACFHFTPKLLKKLRQKKIEFAFITLHIGWGTFAPIRSRYIENHKMHPEFFEITKKTADFLNQRIKKGKKILAVGTTVLRALESASTERGLIRPCKKKTNLYIYPPYKFKIINGLITNFHLPKSSLLILVCAFVNRKSILKAYKQAIKKNYRFYSFGDAMLIK